MADQPAVDKSVEVAVAVIATKLDSHLAANAERMESLIKAKHELANHVQDLLIKSATHDEVEAVSKRVEEIKAQIMKWSGALAVIVFIVVFVLNRIWK